MHVDVGRNIEKLGYEVVVHEHNAGHSLPRKELKIVFAWIAKEIRGTKKRPR